MDALEFDTALAEALIDPDGIEYSPQLRQLAAVAAVRAFSKYYPRKRRFGTGNLFAATAVGATTLLVMGGPFDVGNTLIIDPYTAKSETVTVEDVNPAESTESQTEGTTEVTLAAALTRAHRKDALVTLPQPGLTLVPGQDTYYLPPDWIRPDIDTFDIAVGAKSSVTRGPNFYDALYTFSNALSGTGYAGQTNFGPIYPGSYPIAGDPYRNPNSGIGNGQLVGATRFSFVTAETSLLIVTPAPSSPALLDFFYGGMHSLASVPSVEMEPLLAYARYHCLNGKAAELGAISGWSENNASENTSGNVAALRGLADDALTEFEKLVRDRPYVTTG